MTTLTTQTSSIDRIQRLYTAGKGDWSGCQWPTRFGPAGLNLDGLRSHHAHLMAEATSGLESQRWWDAVDYLRRIENDAKNAENWGARALERWAGGDRQAALIASGTAVELESKYRPSVAWKPLHDELIRLCRPETDRGDQ